MPIPLFTSQLHTLRQYFDSGSTRSYRFRLDQLKRLKESILKHEHDLYDALYADLKKSPEESWVTELGLVIADLNMAIKKLHYWMAPQKSQTNLLNLPSRSRVIKEPLGVVLIIGPWNYPLQLLFNPLVGAIAAGNCIVLKPSELAPATEAVMEKIISETFPPAYVSYVKGPGADIVTALLGQENNFRFDHVFFTGSTVVGRLVYKMAADKLVPVTLELGGKSPCVVEADANIKVAARRIAVTKFSNAGQMCVAPDYVLVHRSVEDQLVHELSNCIKQFFGDRPEESDSYGRIINDRQFDRIVSYLSQGKLAYGGRHDRSTLFIEPTILTDLSPAASLKKDEIFGPVLPVVSFETKAEAAAIISENPTPLAFYVFTSSGKNEDYWMEKVAFGGGCVNNASWHLTNHYLPFGGRGPSGIGNYHGKHSFDSFSHHKAVMKTPSWFDPAIKYPPFKGKLSLFKRVIR